jgi:hypothetical protein
MDISHANIISLYYFVCIAYNFVIKTFATQAVPMNGHAAAARPNTIYA